MNRTAPDLAFGRNEAPFLIRRATGQDAAAAAALLRDSITQLCVADHQNDPVALEQWLHNKTPEHFLQWLANPESCIVVAEMEAVLCGVGGIRKNGELDFCYILPGRERLGIGRSLLSALEAQAALWGLGKLHLISTLTARHFYERHGFVLSDAEPASKFGLPDYHYIKLLTTDAATG
jgi:GNAT superfamily N-acetyltransferase